ncbi:hypothetical protein U1Q18_031152, partial [Sarracenia purpurea var. burkii]
MCGFDIHTDTKMVDITVRIETILAETRMTRDARLPQRNSGAPLEGSSSKRARCGGSGPVTSRAGSPSVST